MLALESGYVASLTSGVFQGFLFTPSHQAQWHIWMGDSGRMRKRICLMRRFFIALCYGFAFDLFGQEVIVLSVSLRFKACVLF